VPANVRVYLIEGLRWAFMLAVFAVSFVPWQRQPPPAKPFVGNTFVDGIVLTRQIGSQPPIAVPDPKSPQFPFDALAWFGHDAMRSCQWTLRLMEMQDARQGDKPSKYACQTRRIFIRPKQ
jgi:hypothetical protein